MEGYGLLLENPRRRRKTRRKARRRKTTSRHRRANPTRRRRRSRRRNPGAITMSPNPRRRRRRRRTHARRRHRRRNPSMRGLIGGAKPALKRGVEIVVADMVGEALSRAATKFGGSKVLAMAKVPTQYIGPGMRILVGLFGGKLLRMLPVRQVRSPAFLSTFSAVNVAFGLMALTGGIRAKAFSAVGLSDYDIDDAYGGSIGPSYMGDWETASDGVGDWETASDGVGGYELAAVAPPAGILGTPPHGVLDYDSGGY